MEKLKLPSVNLNPDSLDIKSEEELQAAVKKEQGGNRLLPGMHVVKVVNIKSHGAAKNDKSWMNLEFVLQGADDKTITPRILVPFKKLKYGEKQTTFPLLKFREFMAGFGVEFKVEDTLTVVKKWFPDAQKTFIGRELEITIGYKRAYAQFVSKNDEGESVWHLIDKEGNPVESNGEVLIFPKRDAVENYANANNIPYDKFSDILKYSPVASDDADEEDF